MTTTQALVITLAVVVYVGIVAAFCIIAGGRRQWETNRNRHRRDRV